MNQTISKSTERENMTINAISHLRSFFKYTTMYLAVMISTVAAQPGSIDFSFNSFIGANDEVLTTALQQDGKIIIGGNFTSYNGTPVKNIARLNEDGTLDTSLNIGTGPNAGTGSTSFINSIVIQSDGKIIAGGNFSSFNGVSRSHLVRLNTDGSLDNLLGSGPNGPVSVIKIRPDGKFFVGGIFSGYNGIIRECIALVNTNGSLDGWTSNGLNSNNGGMAIIAIAIQTNGNILIGGHFTSYNGSPVNDIARLNANGTLDNSFNSPLTTNGSSSSVTTISIQDDQKIIIGGKFIDYNSNYLNPVARLNTNGTIDSSFEAKNVGSGFSIVHSTLLQSDGKIIVGGDFSNINGIPKRGFVRLNQNGSIDGSFDSGLGLNYFGSTTRIRSILIQPDSKIIIGGRFTSINGVSINGVARIRGNNGFTLGKVYIDLNQNCLIDTTERLGINGANLSVQPGSIITQSNYDGYYYIDSLPVGTYTATVDTSNRNWILTCPVNQTFTVTNPNGFTQAPNFGFKSRYPCSKPDVSLVMPRMRRGFGNQVIYIEACNLSTATDILTNAYVEIQLPSSITVQSGSLSYTNLGGNKYRVNVGTLNVGQCLNFTLSVTVTTASFASQTLCLSAELFPQVSCVFDSVPTPYQPSPIGSVSPCTLPWDRSSLKVEGSCVGDSVRFVIYNTSDFGNGDMDCFSPLRIYVDGQSIRLDSIRITGGDSVVIMYPGNGHTIRLEADQHPLHPGRSRPNASVENCGVGTWTPGIINTMPQDDADPIIDIFCGQVSAPYDPNDKTGFPLGVGSTHDILRNQDIEYLIRFQNIGTDTAVNVVILDTLTTDLDIFSVISGVSSHPYEFRMHGPRVLEWRFNNIMLPDSNTNEPASNGFVTFKVKQNKDLPFGTVIENTANIYFDFEAPVVTNTYFHTVSEKYSEAILGIAEKYELSNVYIYPNPVDQVLNFETKERVNEVFIYDVLGHLVYSIEQPKNNSIDVSKLSSGVYIAEIKTDNGIAKRRWVKE